MTRRAMIGTVLAAVIPTAIAAGGQEIRIYFDHRAGDQQLERVVGALSIELGRCRLELEGVRHAREDDDTESERVHGGRLGPDALRVAR